LFRGDCWRRMTDSGDMMEVEAPAKPVAPPLHGPLSIAQLTSPWVEKYRPESLGDVIAHHDIVATLNRFVDQDKLPHLLLYGPPGTGKTSTVLALAKRIFGTKVKSMTLELNASDDRGIDIVKNEIKEFAGTRTIFGAGFKMIILDEADNMTNAAQFALRRVIENYTSNVRFCLICNYVNKIIPALQSRCTRFRFSPLETIHIRPRLRDIAKKEAIEVSDEALVAVERLSGGDMRKCLNVLQSAAMSNPNITEEAIYLCTGQPLPADILRITQSLMEDPFEDCFDLIASAQKDAGLALIDIVRCVHAQVLALSLPTVPFARLMEAMADLEYRLTFAIMEKVQLGSLVGMFWQLRSEIAAMK